MHSATSSDLKPLLKWVGGKRQLLPEIRRFYPSRFNQYIEPFFGSGAVFFDLRKSGALDGHHTVLIDSNADLIGCYETVRDSPDEVAGWLERLAEGHARSDQAHYYAVRDQRFNPQRAERRRAGERMRYTPELAAIFIYLNRTGFNGLFRVNGSGAFNVPAGRYVRPRIADRARLLDVSRVLATPAVELLWGSFDRVASLATAGDFVYFDPPYAPLTRTANFTGYTAPRFDQAAQEQLQALIVDLAARGCRVLLSNSTAPEIAALYDGNRAAEEAGLRAYRVPARRAVNSHPGRRGPVDEYLITNIPRQPPARVK